jgi:hypothetical protein
VGGRGRHHEPPEVTWLLPELELGVLLELMPLELELPELDVPELELPELELPELEEPELVEVEPVDDEPDDVVVLCVEPGSAKASTPAATTLVTVTAVVAERTFSRPFSLAAMARRMPSRCALMSTILWSRLRKSLHEPSR